MPDPLSAERTAEMLLWYFGEPARYHAEGRRRDAPLLDSEVVLKLALGRRIAFAAAAPGDATTLRIAAALYVRHLFFRPDATPYQTLGLAHGASPQAVKESFRLLMQLVHPDRQGGSAAWPDAYAAQANRAYGILRNQDSRERFDREAESRAAMARGLYRAGAAAQASMMPVVQRPKPRLGRRRFAPPKLPEWLTAGMGGFARDHPAATVFTVLIAAAVLTVGTMLWEGHDGALTREVQDAEAPAGPRMLAAMKAVASAAVSVAGSSGRAALPGSGASPKRTEATGAIPQRTASPPSLPDRVTPTATTVPSPEPEASRAPAGPTEPRVAAVASVAPLPPATAEIEALFATFVEAYERGRLDAFAALFDEDADTNLHHGRAAIRGEYDELFRLSQSRKMLLTRVNWRRVGDRALAKGEITVKIAWRDGREVEQRLAVDMELVRRDGRVVIAKLSHQPKS